MMYFKDKEQHVYAYTKSNIEQVSRLTELEALLSEKEPTYTHAYNVLHAALLELNEAISRYDSAIASEEPDEGASELENDVNEKTASYNVALTTFSKIESEYRQLKSEYEEIPLAFFDIRENIQSMKKMTDKEVESYLNPPKSKGQHIAEAEMKKQLCAEDAEKNITILERKVRLNMATDDDKDLLTAWEIYSVMIADIDTSTAPDITWPVKP
ncbi:tail fiber assembly protein [Providencia sp. wls1914]|uniref:tail fiber assembly protein n=1 Tax=Providencia sp. wls1914 TaxID=2675156 RepID=UPI0012B65C5E|nr:tail fiber assembly protein [Providencia sp. wls1914]MTC70030.1 hypothetical protein [Providencia sp. wls1914]